MTDKVDFTCAECQETYTDVELELYSCTVNNTGVEVDIFLCKDCAEGRSHQ